VSDDAWGAATFEGVARAQRRSVAALTPAQRLRWLAEAQALARQSGALDRAIAKRHRTSVRGWCA